MQLKTSDAWQHTARATGLASMHLMFLALGNPKRCEQGPRGGRREERWGASCIKLGSEELVQSLVYL